MKWCQLSVLCMSSNIVHAYLKKNDLMFLCWLALYTTSLLHHYTKHNFSRIERCKTYICYADISVVYLTYVIGLYKMYLSLAYLLISTHLFTPFVYFLSCRSRILMWDDDEETGEFWHSMMHYFVMVQSHTYMYNYL